MFQYQASEIAAIQAFVAGGGGLLLISNHGPFPNKPSDNQTVNDTTLAAAFGIALTPACFQYHTRRTILMNGSQLNTAAFGSTILDGVGGAGGIEVHNCCGLSMTPLTGFSPTNLQAIATLPSGLINHSPINNQSPKGMVYALTFSYQPGQVIIAGNSGLAGNSQSTYPAPGLIDCHGNEIFLLNCLAYVGGIASGYPFTGAPSSSTRK